MLCYGCTHYPLIKDDIKEVLGENIKFFDGANRLAVHLKDVLNEKNILEPEDKEENINIEFIDSSNLKEKEERFFKYIKMYHDNL